MCRRLVRRREGGKGGRTSVQMAGAVTGRWAGTAPLSHVSCAFLPIAVCTATGPHVHVHSLAAPSPFSQDGNESGVAGVAAGLAPEFSRRARGFELWQKQPRVPQLGGAQAGHAWLAQHYKWGLDRVFLERGHSHVVVVEDDMLFSPGGWQGVGAWVDGDVLVND